MPACRAQTRLGIVRVAVPSLGCPAVIGAVGNVTSFPLPVFGTFTFQSTAAVVEPALSSAGAIIGTHIETANVRGRRFVSNETDSPAAPLIKEYKSDAEPKVNTAVCHHTDQQRAAHLERDAMDLLRFVLCPSSPELPRFMSSAYYQCDF